MKKTISRVLLLVLATALLAVSLTACGGLSGKYQSSLGTTQLEFSGSNVTVYVREYAVVGDFVKLGTGTYVINDTEDGGKTMTITFEGETEDGSFEFGKPVAYVENEDGSFKYGALTFTKVTEEKK